MIDIVSDFNQHHVGHVLKHFNVPLDDSIESQCIQLLYRVVGNNCALNYPHLKKTELAKTVAEETITNIGIEYNLYRKYGDDTFRGASDIDYNALKIAILFGPCGFDAAVDGSSTDDENPASEPVEKKLLVIPDILDDLSVGMAKIFWEDASDLKNSGFYESEFTVPPEIMFLAQIIGLQDIARRQDDLAYPDVDKAMIDEFQLFLDRNATTIRTLVNDTQIGRELETRLNFIESLLKQVVYDFFQDPSNIPSPRAHTKSSVKLTLVRTPEPL